MVKTPRGCELKSTRGYRIERGPEFAPATFSDLFVPNGRARFAHTAAQVLALAHDRKHGFEVLEPVPAERVERRGRPRNPRPACQTIG